jgi:hypothetical protein
MTTKQLLPDEILAEIQDTTITTIPYAIASVLDSKRDTAEILTDAISVLSHSWGRLQRLEDSASLDKHQRGVLHDLRQRIAQTQEVAVSLLRTHKNKASKAEASCTCGEAYGTRPHKAGKCPYCLDGAS